MKHLSKECYKGCAYLIRYHLCSQFYWKHRMTSLLTMTVLEEHISTITYELQILKHKRLIVRSQFLSYG